jgi:hypothetical protein
MKKSAENMDKVVESGLKWGTVEDNRAGDGGRVGDQAKRVSQPGRWSK